MSTPSRDLFNLAVKELLAPGFRRLGFKGSGNNYRRQRADVIDAINIQSDRYGESFCVNFGLHFTCLPRGWRKDFPPLSQWKEIDCEFRTRLAPNGQSDYWWSYGGTIAKNKETVWEVQRLYLMEGETLFTQVESSEQFAEKYTLDLLLNRENQTSKLSRWHGNEIRLGLALARIHYHHGNIVGANECAKFALQQIKTSAGVGLIEDLMKLANAT